MEGSCDLRITYLIIGQASIVAPLLQKVSGFEWS